MDIEDTKSVVTEVKAEQRVVMGGTGDGRIKTLNVETPPGMPDQEVHLIPTALAVLVRAFETFLTIIVSLLGAGMATDVIPARDFLDLLGKCASLSLAGVGLSMLKDLIVVAGRLKRRWPLLDV